MLTKSELKKRFIIEKSREIFKKKGFQMVTMSDIVNACEISRGGLYRYYKNTFEIFMEVLQMEQEETGIGLTNAMQNKLSAPIILETFLKEQKKELLQKDETLTVAVYEFFFLHRDDLEENILQKQFDRAKRILTELIQYGIDRKEFCEVDQQTVAKHIILFLEGIRVSSKVMYVTEELLDEQFNFIRKHLVNDES